MLRHFAGKQRVHYENSIALCKTVQPVPAVYGEALTNTLDQIVSATEALPKTLQRRVKTGRSLSHF